MVCCTGQLAAERHPGEVLRLQRKLRAGLGRCATRQGGVEAVPVDAGVKPIPQPLPRGNLRSVERPRVELVQ
jgi:hypothetical protein